MATSNPLIGHDAHGHAYHGPRVLPRDLSAPQAVAVWRMRALVVAAIATVVSLLFLMVPGGASHMLRAYLLGFMMCFGFAGGGLCLLMLQYVTGGKWGLLLRRPLEAMTRTTPLLVLLFVPLMVFGKHLWLWARYTTAEAVETALHSHAITEAQAHALNYKRAMLSPESVIVQMGVVFGFMLLWSFFLNKWSLDREADPAKGTLTSFEYWRVKNENLSGIGILLYVIVLTVAAIDLIMSLDIAWYSSVWGFLFLVGQGYAVLALGVYTSIRLASFEPYQSILRKTEQYDLGKFILGFVMLNIYLAFAQFLIIWSANSPEEIPWYINRVNGGWWTITACDFIFHWVIPFCCLLSRDFKYSRKKMLALTGWMIFARCFDLFWLIEPNFPDARANLHLAGNFGILAYLTVPVAVIALWMAYYLTQLMARPVVVLNDPHTAEILEMEHAH